MQSLPLTVPPTHQYPLVLQTAVPHRCLSYTHTPFAPPAPVLLRLCLLSATGAPPLIVLLHHVLSAGALISTTFCSSASCCAPLVQLVAVPPPIVLASTIHLASTFHRAPLVRLIVALPGALPPPSWRSSAWCLGLHLSLHPSHLVVCCIGRRLGLSY